MDMKKQSIDKGYRPMSKILICMSALLTQSSAFTFHGKTHHFHPFCISPSNNCQNSNVKLEFPSLYKSRASSSLQATVSEDASEEMMVGITSIDKTNDELEVMLSNLREEKFFRLYSVDILGSCEYLPQELFECYSESCEIYPVDEDEVSYCS